MYNKSLVCFHFVQFLISIQVHHSIKQKMQPTQNQDSGTYCSHIESGNKSVFFSSLLLNPFLHIPISQIAFVILKADHFFEL